ncbi:hypothetical protein AX16_003001 [Volvariella volvacea WC 439]|nr:hypothetical protein AX16_003001 [Volvariella volvacea WC 439]
MPSFPPTATVSRGSESPAKQDRDGDERQPLLPSRTKDSTSDLDLDTDGTVTLADSESGYNAISRRSARPGLGVPARRAVAGPSAIEGASLGRDEANNGEAYDNVPQAKRKLGFWSVVFLIFNRIIGTGIYATPSSILRGSGSVGLALLMWVLGSLVAAAGTWVYVELGTGLPRSGGEKNYLEFIYRRPKFLATCAFSIYAFISNTSAANALVFGEYIAHTFNLTPTPFLTRILALTAITTCIILHGCFLHTGLKLQNFLGLFKLVILSAIAMSGILCLCGVPGFGVLGEYEKPRNFQSWKSVWEGGGTGVNALTTALYNVIWSYIGYTNANYSMSEIKDPVRTLKRAAPVAVACAASVYLLVNVAYFAAVSKMDILDSKRIIAALYFRNLFGPETERALSGFISLSILGNLLATYFSYGRIIQELGREGVLPFSSVFASNKPIGAPLAALTSQVVFSVIIMSIPPASDAYLFIINLSAYGVSLINTIVSFGLLLLYTASFRSWNWDPPFRAPRIIVVLYFLSNLFLILMPFIPPTVTRVYEKLPYWSHPVASISLSSFGIVYWYIWCVVLPKRKGYTLEREWVLQDDGVSRYVFRKVKHGQSS